MRKQALSLFLVLAFAVQATAATRQIVVNEADQGNAIRLLSDTVAVIELPSNISTSRSAFRTLASRATASE